MPMVSTTTALAAAILYCQPALGTAAARTYATVLAREAREHRFDAMTAAALVCHESRWVAGAVSPDGEDWGLGQIRARHIGACRLDADPVGAPSKGCRAVQQSLLDPGHNLRLMAQHIEGWKKLCRTKTGRAVDRAWLAGYAGLSRPSKGQWCGQSRRAGRWTYLPQAPQVKAILALRRSLHARASRTRRPGKRSP
jgi:hypothetical protein